MLGGAASWRMLLLRNVMRMDAQQHLTFRPFEMGFLERVVSQLGVRVFWVQFLAAFWAMWISSWESDVYRSLAFFLPFLWLEDLGCWFQLRFFWRNMDDVPSNLGLVCQIYV